MCVYEGLLINVVKYVCVWGEGLLINVVKYVFVGGEGLLNKANLTD